MISGKPHNSEFPPSKSTVYRFVRNLWYRQNRNSWNLGIADTCRKLKSQTWAAYFWFSDLVQDSQIGEFQWAQRRKFATEHCTNSVPDPKASGRVCACVSLSEYWRIASHQASLIWRMSWKFSSVPTQKTNLQQRYQIVSISINNKQLPTSTYLHLKKSSKKYPPGFFYGLQL